MKQFFDKWIPKLWGCLAILFITVGLITAVMWVCSTLIKMIGAL